MTFTASGLAAGAAQLVITTQPPTSGTAGAPLSPAVVVAVKDASGNAVTSFTSGLKATIASGPAGATIVGMDSVQAAAGIATFSSLGFDKAGTYTVTFASSGLTSATTNSFTIVAGAAKNIAADSGGAQSAGVGTALAAPLVVRVTDMYGNPVGGTTITWAVTGGGGSVDSTTTVTNAQGRTRTRLTVGNTAGTNNNTVTASGSGLTGSPVTFLASATAGAATQLVFTTGPTTTTAGVPMAPIVVTAKDASGNVATGFTGGVSIDISPNANSAIIQNGTTGVSAVAGVATFTAPGISIRKAGTGYTLKAMATGFTTVTSGTFDITPAPAFQITADSGDTQSAIAGTSLLNKFVVLVRDSVGNPVSGTGVTWAVASGGGSLDSTSTVTNAAGRTRARLTLGSTAGANTVTASSGSLSGSPITFSATGTSGAVAQLVITTQPSNVVAGVPFSPAVVVEARDAGGNLNTAFTDNVSAVLVNNPTSATLGGTTSVAAVGGVATFSNFGLAKVGTGYTVGFSSGALNSTASSAFNVTPSTAWNTVADSGLAQTGPAGQPLAQALVVAVTDSFGNPIAGRTVTWTVKTGGGTLDSTTTITNANGRTRSKWTLGLTVGAQQVVAKAGLADSAVFGATGQSVMFNKVWKGFTDTQWATASNWSPAGVPAATDSVGIDSVANHPVLSSAVTVARLGAMPGVIITLGANDLTVNGNVGIGAGASITATTGRLVLAGTSSTIVGPSFPDARITGTYSLGGGTTFTDSVTIETGGQLDAGNHAATINGALTTTGTGTFLINGATGSVSTGGNVTLSGGNVALTDGELRVGGNFNQTAGTFQQNAGTTKFVGSTSHSVSVSDTSSNTYFGTLGNGGTGDVTLMTPLRAKGPIKADVGAGRWLGSNKAVRAFGAVMADSSQFAVDTLHIWQGTGMQLSSKLVTTVVVTGNPVSAATSFVLNGNLIVGDGGNFQVNSQFIRLANFATTGTGQLTMSGSDSLEVLGNATFGGGVTAGTLSGGAMTVGGNFAQLNNSQSFKAGPAHRTWLAGNGNQTISFANPDSGSNPGCTSSCFGQLRSSKTAGIVTFLSSAKADSSMLITGVDSLLAPGFTLQARGDFNSNSRVDGTVRARYVKYAGAIYRTGGTFAVDTLVTFGPNAVLMGSESKPVIVQGPVAMPDYRMYEAVIIDGPNGILTTSGSDTVAALGARNGGRLKMIAANDTLRVSGKVFMSGAGAHQLNAGTLILMDSVGMAGAVYTPDSAHTTVFERGTGTQQITINGLALGRIIFRGGAKKQFTSSPGNLAANGSIYVASGSDSITSATGFTLEARKSVFDSAYVLAPYQLAVSGEVTAKLPARIVAPTFAVWSDRTLQDTLHVLNSMYVGNSPAVLDLNGKRLRVGLGFSTQGSGRLKMVNAADSLITAGGAPIFFNGANTETLLTDGTIVAGGNFSQGGSDSKAFVAGPNHTVKFTGTGVKTITLSHSAPGQTRFGKLLHDMTDTLYLKNDVRAYTFATGAGATHPVRVGAGAAPSFPSLIVQGADIDGAAFNGIHFQLLDSLAVPKLANVSFVNSDPAGVPLIIKRTGSAGPPTGTLPALSGTWSFGTTPSTGHYMDAEDTDGSSPDVLNVNFTGTVAPGSHGGKLGLVNGATTNWTNTPTALWTGATSTAWATTSNWSANVLPTTTDSVHIPSGTPNVPALSANTTVRSITVASGARLDIGTFSLDVTERASADTAASGGFACAGGRVRMVTGAGVGAVKGRFCKLEIQTNRATSGATVVSDSLLISAGELLPGADSLVTYHLDVIGSGALVMGASANVTVLGNARFAGAATSTKLTGGVLRVAGDLAQGGTAISLQPGSNHRIVLNGAGTQSVSFTDPDSIAYAGAFGAHLGSLSIKKPSGRVTFPDGVKARGRVAIDSVGIDSVDVRNNKRFIVEGDSLIAARLRAPRVAISGGFKRDSASVLDSLTLYGTGQALLPGSASNVRVEGTVTASTNGSLYGVRIDNNGILEIATPKLTVARFVKGQGQLKMLTAGDTLFITDSASFGTTGDSSLVKAGVIWHTGRYFEARNDGFQSTGSHVLAFARAAADSQRVSFDSFVSYIGANRLYFTGSSPKSIVGIVISNSTVHIGASSGPLVCESASCSYKVRLAGDLVDSTAAGTAFQVGAWVNGRPTIFPRKIFTDLYITDSMTVFTDSLIVQNDLSVEGANAWLNLNGRPTVAKGRFITGSGGRFVMQNASDALRAGTMQLAGGSTTGLLTNGLLAFTYHFLQSGSPTSFAPSGNFVARFDTAAYVGTPEFRFENPTTSRFNTLVLANRTMSMGLGRDLEVDSLVFADSLVERMVQSIDANRRTFTVRSIRADSMVVGSGVRLRLAGSGPIQKLRRARFDNPVTDTAFIVERAGGSINTLSQITFLNAPTSGAYLRAVDTNVADNDTLAVNFTGVSPAGHGGKVDLIGGAKTNWPPGLALSATASGDWSSTSTWSPAVVPTANDDVTIGSGITVQLAAAPGSVRHVTLSGGGTIDLTNQTLQVNGNITAGGSEITGTGTVRMTGGKPHTVTVDTVPNLQVDANSLTTLGGNLLVSGDATLIGTLLVNGQRFEVDGLLNVPPGGGLKMVNAADSVDVYDATFSGVPSDTLLTNGKLVVGNNFTQSGNSLSFAPTGSHVTYLGGDGTGAASLRAERMRALTESATLSNRRNNVQTWNRVQFANPGWSASRFNTLRFDHTNDASVAFASDVYATSAQTVGMTSMRTVYADAAVKFYVKNVDLKKLFFNRIALQLDAGGTMTRLDSLTFQNQPGTANQLTLDVPAAANWTLRALSFESLPTSGKYLVANAAGTSTLTLENPSPGTHGGFIGLTGAVTQNWASTQAYTSASGGIWSTPGTWSPAGVPSRHDDVTITGGTVQLSADASVRNISLNPGAGLDLQFSSLHVTGNYFTDTTATVTASASYAKTYHDGAGTTIRGHLKFADITNSVSLAGWAKAAATLRVVGTGASLDVGANNLQVDGEFWTMDGGTLKMGSGPSKVTVAQNAWFHGGSTTGLITNGVLVAQQNVDVYDDAFDASGTHITEIDGTAGQDVFWSVTGTQGKFNHLTFRNSGIKTINNDIKVGGDLTIAADVSNNIVGSGLVTWSGGAMRDSATSTNGRWAVNTTRLDGTVTTMPVKLSTLLKVNGSLTLTDSLRVNGGMEVAGSLDLNGRRLQVSSLDVNGAGLVKMTAAADTLLVNGLASWHGAVPNITNGVTVFNGSFSQAPGFGAATNTFNPSGSHKTLMQRVSAIDSTVTFSDTTSYFNDLYVGSNIKLASDVRVKGTLSRLDNPAGAVGISGVASNPTLITSGIVGHATYPMNFSGVRLKFVDGTSNYVVQNLNFTDFAALYSNIIFEIKRTTPDPLSIINVNFGSITLGAGSYIKNSGSAFLNPSGPSCSTSISPGQSCP
ncbi:MAG: Ig-like domain-containing protein [Gemmatimonadota bacterium]|nr:Ig-like domain-containing protein [Gemmatimonadota bacterium]